MPAPAGLVVPMRRLLRFVAVAVAVATPLVMLAGWLVAGVPGLWAALLGLAIPVAFFGITSAIALATWRLGPQALGPTVLGSWLLKLVLLLGVLALLRGADFYSRGVFGGVFLVGVIGYLGLEAWVVLRARTPYVDPVSSTAEDPRRLRDERAEVVEP
jgi:hypothetical protein